MKLYELLTIMDDSEGLEIFSRETGKQVFNGRNENCPWGLIKKADIESVETLPHHEMSNHGLRIYIK